MADIIESGFAKGAGVFQMKETELYKNLQCVNEEGEKVHLYVCFQCVWYDLA